MTKKHRHTPIAIAALAGCVVAPSAWAACEPTHAAAASDALFIAFQTATMTEDRDAAADLAGCLADRDVSALGYFGVEATALRARFADALADAGRAEAARALLLALTEAEPDPLSRSRLFVRLAQLAMDQDDLAQAQAFAEQAVAAAESAADPALRAVVRAPLQQRQAVDELILASAPDTQDAALRERIATTAAQLAAIDTAVLSRRRRLGLMGDAPRDPDAEPSAFDVVPVFHVTVGDGLAGPGFGVAELSAPRAYAMASVTPRTPARPDGRRGDDGRALVQDSVAFADPAAFRREIDRETALYRRGEALIFVADPHQRFEDAVRTAGQLAMALELEGVAIVVWASMPGEGPEGALAQALAAALSTLTAEEAPLDLHVIAHGGGADATARALAAAPGGTLASVIFMEPRSSDAAFAELAAQASAAARRAVLYRRSDLASPLGWPGVQTVAFPLPDAEAADREVVADPRYAAVLNDVRALAWFGAPASARCMLSPADAENSYVLSDDREGCGYGRFRIAITLARRLGVADARTFVEDNIENGDSPEAWREVRAVLQSLADPAARSGE